MTKSLQIITVIVIIIIITVITKEKQKMGVPCPAELALETGCCRHEVRLAVLTEGTA
jgi:hypothetical protein